MGTYYRITVVGEVEGLQADLERAVQRRLEAINSVVSTYQEDSELSAFNRLAVGQCLEVSSELSRLVLMSQSIHKLSSGAFNPLVGPLVNRWGFGPSATYEGVWSLPEANEISELLEQISMAHISIDPEENLLCKQANVYLDLSAIAKGYAVDDIAQLLERFEIKSYLVDIGGELKARGRNPLNSAWRLAVEKPDSGLNTIEQIVELKTDLVSLAIATSGDYRNFFEHNEQRYSHTIDPRTGHPVRHALASVTVVDNSAAMADAWATALNVMGWEQAQTIAEQQGLAVFLLQRDNKANLANDVELNRWHSTAFAPFLAN